MSIASIPIINALFSVANPASHNDLLDSQQDDSLIDDSRWLDKAKNVVYQPTIRYRQHALHYMLKGIGYVPAPLLERLNRYLHAPTAEQYPHADAHLRLIIGINNKIKRPLQVSKLIQLRHKFAVDGVAMQAPKVWQQAGAYDGFIDKSNKNIVSWHDEAIANADGEKMIVRCYQSTVGYQKNPDEVVMLFFHGGGFCIGDIDTHHEFCHAISAKTGWSVVSVDYRLAPEYPAPTALRDCLAAYSWLTKHAHNLQAAPSRIVLAGDSAGGCLTALVAQQVTLSTAAAAMSASDQQQYLNSLDSFSADIFYQLKDLPRPFAQWPLYPVTDIETDYPSWSLYGEGLLLDHDDVAVFDSAYMQDSLLSRNHPLISPMLGDNKSLCPSYIIAAELDVLRDEAHAYAGQLQSYDIKVQSYTVLGAPHGFIHLMSIHQGIGRETDYIINEFAIFVRQLLAADADANEQKLLAS